MKFIHYADDATVHMKKNKRLTLASDTSRELDKVDEWLKANRQSLNISKCSFVILTLSKHITEISITIKIINVTQICSTKFLGMNIDNKLLFNEHNQSALQVHEPKTMLLLRHDNVYNESCKTCKYDVFAPNRTQPDHQ